MQMLKGLGPSVAVSKIGLLFLSRIEKRWKNVKRWILHWAICKDCLVHGRCAIVCITIGSDSKTNLPLIVTIIRRLSLYSAWLRLQEGEEGGGQGGGQIGGFGVRWDAPDLGRGSWQWQTDHFNWKPCSEHCCILSGKLANVRNRCTFPILSPPPLLLLHIFKVSLSFKCKAWC